MLGFVAASSCPAADRSRSVVIELSSSQIVELRKFVTVKKFAPDQDYVGFLSDDVVANPDLLLNTVARELIQKQRFSEDSFFDRAEGVIKRVELADTEDRERVVKWIERLMDILKIRDSRQRLNRAFYGFPTER